MPAGPRPLHLRLAGADVVAIATVADVREDRVALRDAAVLRGSAARTFELKHAPSQEIPYAVGLTLVLPLRGARSPYVLVDDARELVVLRDGASAAAWRSALPALLGAGTDHDHLVAVYLGWLDGREESLREAAAAALLDPRSALLPVSSERAVERVRAALDPAAPTPARRVSALLAAGRPEGARLLLAAIRDPDADPQVAETALRSAVQLRLEGIDEALLAALAHDDAEVRRVAVTLVDSTGSAPGLARLPALAAHDPDAGVRREARSVIAASRK
ncbi:MAG: hypothetical protein OZ948_08485 [Deltaproteobacteria bacterium]|nr:hypothetical protein [Deltaproteobacteria bacterium]